jgi:hypothetical protein
MITYYATLFIFLLLNCMSHHIFCLGGMHVTNYVTLTMSSLKLLACYILIPTYFLCPHAIIRVGRTFLPPMRLLAVHMFLKSWMFKSLV